MAGSSSAPPLFNHQVASIRFLADRERALDFSDPGTGKTRVEIEDFLGRRQRGGKCALVLCPVSLMKSAWADDIKKYAPHLRVSIAYAKNRAEAFQEPADVYITNHDATKWLALQRPEFFSRFDTLIIDEISAFKHHTSQRSKSLGRIVKHFNFRRGLSGTPNSNNVTDIWHQCFVIDDGRALGRSFFAFRGAVCSPKQVGPRAEMIKWEPKSGVEQVIAKMIEGITVRHVFEECNDIPENFMYARQFVLSPSHMKLYEKMEKEAILLANNQSVTAVNAAVLVNKLLQIASGAAYNDQGGYTLLDTSRYKLLADLIDERKHSVVFFLWRHQRDELIKELEARNISFAVIDSTVSVKEREQVIDYYQRGFYRTVLCHPQSAAHGITLTKGTSTIWASPTYNLEHFLQGNRRIYRIGQKEKTETVVVLAAHTVEEKVFKVLSDKEAKQANLLEILSGV